MGKQVGIQEQGLRILPNLADEGGSTTSERERQASAVGKL